MNEELKQLAALALRNAFWHDFSALVNKYLAAAEGLDIDAQERQMGDLTSIYGRDTGAEACTPGARYVSIWVEHNGTKPATSYGTLREALECGTASSVYVSGEKVFERRRGKWYFVGG